MVCRFLIFGAVLGTGLLLAAPSGAQQDNSSQAQQKPSQSQSDNRKKDQKKSTAQENPFPEEKSEAAARQAQQQNDPSAPAPQTAPGEKPSTAHENPFPQAESERAAHRGQENQQNEDQQGGGAGKSDFSSSQVKGLDLPGTQAGPLPVPAAKPGYNPELAKQDNKVGTFYLQSGNWKGAYDRFLEAAQVDPGSAEAVWGLGESAAHLGNRDEALRNFRTYLSALPDGPHAKDIRKEMKKMGAEPPK